MAGVGSLVESEPEMRPDSRSLFGPIPDHFLGQIPDHFLAQIPDHFLGQIPDHFLDQIPERFLDQNPERFLDQIPERILSQNPERTRRPRAASPGKPCQGAGHPLGRHRGAARPLANG